MSETLCTLSEPVAAFIIAGSLAAFTTDESLAVLKSATKSEAMDALSL